jgi:hypothetical protein
MSEYSINSFELSDAQWFSPDYGDADPWAGVVAAVDRIKGNSRAEIDRWEIAMSLSTDTSSSGLTPGSRNDEWESFDFEPLSINIVEPICATLHAEITSAQPKPQYLTDGAGYDVRERTEKRGQFIDGVLYENNVHTDVGPDVVDSAIRFGIGHAFVIEKFGRVCVERVMPWEVVVDMVDGRDRRPRTLYRVQYMEREVAKARWPGNDEAFDSAPVPSGEWSIRDGSTTDVILIYEAWHLRSGPKAKDGSYIVCTNGDTIVDKEWGRDSFPVATYRWIKRPLGYCGRGVPEQLLGIQYNINKTCMAMDIAHDTVGLQIWAQRGSNINKTHIQNTIGTIGEYDTTPPVFMTPVAVSGEMYQWLESQIQRGFKRVGVSELSAQAQLPVGLRNASGRALRTYIDTSSKRFIDALRGYENFYVDLAKCIDALMEELAETNPDYDVVYRGEEGVVRVNWKQVKLDGPYIVKCRPSNLLPDTPTGRLEAVTDMVSGGLAQAMNMEPETLAEMVNAPDLKAQTDLYVAPKKNIERIFSKMFRTREYIAPEASWPLQMCLHLGVLREQQALIDGEDEERMGLIRDWNAAVLQHIADARPAPPPPVDPMQAQQMAINNLAVPPGGAAPPPAASPMPAAAA